MSNKVAINTELTHTEPLLLEEIWVWFLQDFGHIFINRSIHKPVLCLLLFKTRYFIFINICHLSTELMANSTIACIWMNLIEPVYFPHKAHHSFSALGNTSQNLNVKLGVGGILHGEITGKKHKHVRKVAPLWLWEEHLLQHASWNKKALCHLSPEYVHLYVSLICACVCEWL